MRPLWPLGALAIALGYLWWSYANDQSLGMHLLGIQLLDETGGRPHLIRAAFRAAAILPPLTALLALASSIVPDRNGTTEPLSGFAAWSAGVLVAFGVADYLWMLGDPRRQALHDLPGRTFVTRA